MSGKGRDRSLPCVADAPDGFYGQILTITSAAIGTRPALLVGGAPVGSSRASQGSDRGAVAVRWQLTASYDGRPFEQSIMAIYRFENGRIAEDWGISIPALWP